MASISDLELYKLCDRYPFSLEELQILIRCHKAMRDDGNKDSPLMKMALCSPYSYFFLPGDEMKNRINFIEDHVLPMGFPNELRAAIAADAFVNYANEEQDLNFERFLEGLADTGRRGPKEALRILYEVLPDPVVEDIVGLCFRLTLASEILIDPAFDEKSIHQKLSATYSATNSLVNSLKEAMSQGADAELTKNDFITWAEQSTPMLSSTLSTFIHNLLFHGHPYPVSRIPYTRPVLDNISDIFLEKDSHLLFPMSLMSTKLSGKMGRLYSSVVDGSSFNRLEWNLLGYGGPTLLLIQTECDVILGAFASQPWRDTDHFYGTSESFVFQIEPVLRVFHATGKDNHFMYCHGSSKRGSFVGQEIPPLGLGFGGSIYKPRLFLPESLEECSADFFDSTYESGDLLPKEAMESFRIKHLEVWGVGGDKVMASALQERSNYRDRVNASIDRARTVLGPSVFVDDLKSGLIPNKIFNTTQVRGNQEYCVNDSQGGYKLEMDTV